ncbi:hypothetical protein H0R92_09460 [Treponema sp. OMZ 840]|uniref:hypothetical protein n=1 Tax=Treponema sp. OMZ 840 TaxID=244313 RepID=UPI003D8D57C2
MKMIWDYFEPHIIPMVLVFMLFIIVKDENAYKRIKEKKIAAAIYIAIIAYCISLIAGLVKVFRG